MSDLLDRLPFEWSVIAAVVVGAALLRVLAGRGRSPAPPCGFRRQDALLTPGELEFFRVLVRAVGDEYAVFAKVRVADVLLPDRRQEKPARQASVDQICARHFDFVLCDPDTLRVAAVVELNDPVQGHPRRRERDAFLRCACESAGLRLIEVEARGSYAPATVRDMILRAPVPPAAPVAART
ncbi:MAG TPA: DUF2726 domain-containing protein [Woeseiaceae bacterium]|nr:DUF2726 domain-containing protein [Woeseiaceae bacterium]